MRYFKTRRISLRLRLYKHPVKIVVASIQAVFLVYSGYTSALEVGNQGRYLEIEATLAKEGHQNICQSTTVLDRNEIDPKKNRILTLKVTANYKQQTAYILVFDEGLTKELVYRKVSSIQTFSLIDLAVPSGVLLKSNLANFLEAGRRRGDGVLLHGASVLPDGTLSGTTTIVVNVGAADTKGDLAILTTSSKGIVTMDEMVATKATCSGYSK